MGTTSNFAGSPCPDPTARSGSNSGPPEGGTARVVEDPERRRQLMLQMKARSSGCGPPGPMRPLLKLTRIFDYQGEIDMAVAAGGTFPVVEIFPRRD